jgi:hypothetical protein
MRKPLCILFVAALSISLRAQDSRADVSVGYSLVHTDLGSGSRNLNGFEIDYLVKPSFRRQWFSVEMNFARYFGSASIPLRGVCDVPGCITPIMPSNVGISSFHSGVRFSRTGEKLSPFAKFLVGGSSVLAKGTGISWVGVNRSAAGFSYLAGLGTNYQLSRRFGWYVEADFLQTHLWGNFQTDARFSTGPVVFLGLPH